MGLILNPDGAGADYSTELPGTMQIGDTAFATIPRQINVVGQTITEADTNPSIVGTGDNQNGIIRIDQTVGGSSMGADRITFATGLPPRPSGNKVWSEFSNADPQPLNADRGRVGVQDALYQLRVRTLAAGESALVTRAESNAAFTRPHDLAEVIVKRGGRIA